MKKRLQQISHSLFWLLQIHIHLETGNVFAGESQLDTIPFDYNLRGPQSSEPDRTDQET
jgi:hypothetical protein